MLVEHCIRCYSKLMLLLLFFVVVWFRLISEMTVEENILKKANQKRLLVDVSIEGGNFTTAFFKTVSSTAKSQ